MRLFDLFGTINLNDNGVNRQIDAINNKAGSLGKKFGAMAKKVAVAGVALGAAVGAVGVKAINMASDAQEMESKFNTVFGNMSTQANEWSKNFRDKVGGSRIEIKGMLADSQDMLTGFGATKEEAFNLSTKIQGLGTDLASFQNITGGSEEAVEKLRKGLLGETENLKSLGIVINENVMKQKMQELGYKKKYKDLTELEKIELRYAIAVDQSKNAIGDAEKTKRSYANIIRDLKGQFKDLIVQLGERFLPKVQEVAKWVQDHMPEIKQAVKDGVQKAVDIFTNFKDALQWVKDKADILIPALAALVTYFTLLKIVKVITGFMKAMKAQTLGQAIVTGILNVKQAILNALMLSNPIGLIILAIAALIAIGIALYMNWDKIKAKAIEWVKKIKAQWDWLKQKTSEVWEGMKKAIVDKVVSWVKKVQAQWDFIKEKAGQLWDKIKSVGQGIKDTWNKYVVTPIQKGKEKIGRIIDRLKALFDFDFKWPKIKMPRFSIKGSMNPVKWIKEGVPKLSVRWNAVGAVMKKPTIFGMAGNSLLGGGEAGPEGIVPLAGRHMYPLADAVAARLRGQQSIKNTFHISQLVVREEADIDRIAEALEKKQDRKLRARGAI